MNEATRKRVLYAVLMAAVLWGLYMQPWKGHPRNEPGPAPSETAMPAAVEAVTAGPATEFVALTPGADWTADPFRPSAPQESGDTEERPSAVRNAPVLQGTMTVRGDEVCVIDGQVCKTGDRSGSWTIVEIGHGGVTLVGPNQERLTLNTNDSGQRK